MQTKQVFGFEIRVERPMGGTEQVDLAPLWPKLRAGMSLNHRTGRVTQVRFPAPFDLLLFDGEMVRGKKAERLRAACASLGEA